MESVKSKKQQSIKPLTMKNSLLKEITKPDMLTMALKLLFGISLLAGITKTSVDVYFKIQDRKKK